MFIVLNMAYRYIQIIYNAAKVELIAFYSLKSLI